MKQNIKQYYLKFYNNNLFRDFRLILTNGSVKTPYLPYDPKTNFKKNISDFIFKSIKVRNSVGALTGEITFYKSFGEYRIKDKEDKLTDRLFFDFDVEDKQLHDIKSKINDARVNLKGADRVRKIRELQLEYQDLIFTTDVLEKPFNELKILHQYFKDSGIKSYPVFSASKGFHLYIFFNECKLINYSEISYKIAMDYKKALKLDTLDLAVNKDALARVSRLPYSRHETSNLITTPFNMESETLSEVLENSRKQNFKEFDFNAYKIDDENFTKTLISADQEFSIKNKELIEVKKKVSNNTIQGSISDESKDDLFKDMRILCKLLLGNPEREFSNYNSYICPFHDDTKPSARVYEKNFLCASECLSLNYFDFIKKYFNLKNDSDVKEKMLQLRKGSD